MYCTENFIIRFLRKNKNKPGSQGTTGRGERKETTLEERGDSEKLSFVGNH